MKTYLIGWSNDRFKSIR